MKCWYFFNFTVIYYTIKKAFHLSYRYTNAVFLETFYYFLNCHLLYIINPRKRGQDMRMVEKPKYHVRNKQYFGNRASRINKILKLENCQREITIKMPAETI